MVGGGIKSMKSFKNGYIITYIIDIVLTIICIALIIYYYSNLSVGWNFFDGELFGFAQIDLAQFWLIIFLLILLFCSLTALSVYLIIAIRQNKENCLEKSTKLGIIIIPIIFCMLLPIITGISVAITPSETFNPEWLCSDPDFEKWTKTRHQYYYQENCFGKAIDLEHSSLTPDDDEFDLYLEKRFNCYFRKSNYPKIFNKFVKIPPRFYNEKYEETRNGIQYTVYTYITTEGDEFYDDIRYYIVIESDNSYLLGEYKTEQSEKISDYSLDDFIDDVFVNYSSWNAE